MLDKPNGGEDFDVEVEDAIADRPAKRAKGQGGPKANRTTRNKKFGFGGPKKHSKQNTKASTDNFGPGAGKGKGRPKAGMNKRPGKSKRMATRSKR
jgi:rRNA-processing protein EBP2